MYYREAKLNDNVGIAKLLSTPETEDFWINRVTRYFNKEHHPQQALLPRVIFIANDGQTLVGVIAGHLTKRFGCQGELQWINVTDQYRRKRIASELLIRLAKWFVSQNALSICVDVGSEVGRSFYLKHGAQQLNEHWMIWKDIRVVLENATSGKDR